jgi:hypothetical protein
MHSMAMVSPFRSWVNGRANSYLDPRASSQANHSFSILVLHTTSQNREDKIGAEERHSSKALHADPKKEITESKAGTC